MTVDEFLKYASNQLHFERLDYVREEIEQVTSQSLPYEVDGSAILDFFVGVGRVSFVRTENISKDTLTINIQKSNKVEYWDDIGCIVMFAGFIQNCAGIIIEYYISEKGAFYDHKHKCIANNHMTFFDYLTTVEFDFHPIITTKTYEILSHIGWSEYRLVDTNELIRELKQHDISLTESQLSFISKFSGLSCCYKSEQCYFATVNEIIETVRNQKNAFRSKSEYEGMVWNNVLSIGNTMSGPLSIDANGIILFMKAIPYGRTTMECIQHLMAETCDYYHLPLEPLLGG